LKNAKEVVAKFEKRLSIEVWKQEKLDMIEKRDCRGGDLPGKYIAKML